MTNTVSRIIPDETLSDIIHIESGGRPTAKAPTTSAAGLGQFINATWLATVRKHEPTWAIGKDQAELLELDQNSPCSRFNARASIEMLARLTEDNAAYLGAGYTDGDLYLAHFAGVCTARKLLQASPDLPASRVFSAAAIKANRSILAGKTCGDVRAWADRKMKAAGGHNWIAVYWTGAKPTLTAKTKTAAGAVAAGGAGTVAVTTQQGWSPDAWLVVIACVAAAAAFFAWRWWHRRNTPVKLEEGGDLTWAGNL